MKANKKKRKLKTSFILTILIIIIIAILGFCIKDIFDSLNTKSQKKVEVLDTIKGYGYQLNENDPEYFKELFKKLKKELESDDMDEEEYAKKCAEAIIKFPCEDGSLAAVASYSITSSDFYKRISTLQNEWFTPHSIAKLSFGDVKVIKQNDDSFIANVIWNYYISNGSLEREYHGAYQMSFLKVNGTYKLAGFAIDNELNPDNEGAYYD